MASPARHWSRATDGKTDSAARSAVTPPGRRGQGGAAGWGADQLVPGDLVALDGEGEGEQQAVLVICAALAASAMHLARRWRPGAPSGLGGAARPPAGRE
jgi:hypothetical protein